MMMRKCINNNRYVDCARNGQGYIGVICSYIDAKFNLNEITLTVNYVRYPHTAQHISESLEETFNEWNLQDKVFTITTDNAANIKKAIMDMKNVRWQGCNAHTLQLIVEKALVLVKPLIVRVKWLIEFLCVQSNLNVWRIYKRNIQI